MIAAVPLTVLAIFATATIVLYVVACALDKNWYPLFVILPTVIAIICVYGITCHTEDTENESWINLDGWVFLCTVFVVFAIAIPVLFYRCSVLKLRSMIMILAGDVAAGIGVAVFMILNGETEETVGF